MRKEITDVVIVGAGLSGIGAGAHLKMKCPNKRYVLLEARDDLGGTWDLFKYPGIRSDSDMYTLGFSFSPWKNPQAIADGPAIKQYIKDTAEEYGVTPNIRLGHKVISAYWSSQTARWEITAQSNNGEMAIFESKFLFMGSGYYSYDQGHNPDFPGKENFTGQIVHPQFWPENLDYTNKRVVVIGSGATAVTILPAMANTAAHVTLLQRSPSYIVARPAQDRIANFFKRIFSDQLAYKLTRWKNIAITRYFMKRIAKNPQKAKDFILKLIKKELPDDQDISDFTPSYMPWDQRICLSPDGDLFQALRDKKASVVTDHIEQFTSDGILLKSGKKIAADIIVTATGLTLVTGGNVDIQVDGKPIKFGDTLSYKGVMFSNVPNFSLVFGYTMASWTLKADVAAQYFCRLINYMDKHDYAIATPALADDNTLVKRPMLSFTSGYVQRAIDELPKQSDQYPWVIHQDYTEDKKILLHNAIDDGFMKFDKLVEEQDLTTTAAGN